jgi:hypothetical protein
MLPCSRARATDIVKKITFNLVVDFYLKICYSYIVRGEVNTMRRNAHKKETFEDKFARRYYCEHARLNSIRSDKKEQHKKFRRDFKKSLDKLLYE